MHNQMPKKKNIIFLCGVSLASWLLAFMNLSLLMFSNLYCRKLKIYVKHSDS